MTLLNGKGLRGGKTIETVDALGRVNGRQEYATQSQVDAIKGHVRTYKSPSIDYRQELRRVEQRLLSPEFSGFLIGNQCLDFQKQDGVTEIEEAIMANHVERNLNDLLLVDEKLGRVEVNRQPIYVSCVSNFTNFLDLFRKTIRNMELGIPCIVLGRSNTVQHSYRWTKLLMDLVIEEGVDPGMITYISCPVEDIVDITQNLQDYTGNLYATSSRELAASIKSGYDKIVASTGGPNTLVATDWTPEIQQAIRTSAAIECAGQCTALRHAMIPPSVMDADIEDMLDGTTHVASAEDALKANGFDGVFVDHRGSPPGPSKDGYSRHPHVDASYRISAKSLPPNYLDEHWRKVVIDVSKMDPREHVDELADWLNTNQPISLAITGKTREESLEIGLKLWSLTGLVVNTIGTPESPALTCQARPQEGEVFGEFPPRRDLFKYTKYPVIVPSSTPSYDTKYSLDFLEEQSQKSIPGRNGKILADLSDDAVKGYCVTLLEYLRDATHENPKLGFGSARTAMWGLQRPPLQTKTYLMCDMETSWNALAPPLLLFFATNANTQMFVSIPEGNLELKGLCEKHGVDTITSFTVDDLHPGDNIYSIPGSINAECYPMVGQFLTTLMPVGHIKSTLPGDDDFVEQVKSHPKWLQMRD